MARLTLDCQIVSMVNSRTPQHSKHGFSGVLFGSTGTSKISCTSGRAVVKSDHAKKRHEQIICLASELETEPHRRNQSLDRRWPLQYWFLCIQATLLSARSWSPCLEEAWLVQSHREMTVQKPCSSGVIPIGQTYTAKAHSSPGGILKTPSGQTILEGKAGRPQLWRRQAMKWSVDGRRGSGAPSRDL